MLTFPVGVRVFPLKGHEITGWYVHRQVEKSTLLDRAFLVGTDRGSMVHIRKALYNEFGGFWQWVLNPSFDIRLAGKLAAPDSGYRDLGRLANCNLAGPAARGVMAMMWRSLAKYACGLAGTFLTFLCTSASGVARSVR